NTAGRSSAYLNNDIWRNSFSLDGRGVEIEDRLICAGLHTQALYRFYSVPGSPLPSHLGHVCPGRPLRRRQCGPCAGALQCGAMDHPFALVALLAILSEFVVGTTVSVLNLRALGDVPPP